MKIQHDKNGDEPRFSAGTLFMGWADNAWQAFHTLFPCRRKVPADESDNERTRKEEATSIMANVV